MIMIFEVFVQPLKESRIESVFITVGAWKHLQWLTGIAIFAPVGPLNSWAHKRWVESNRLSKCIEATLMMSRNDFILYRNDRTPSPELDLRAAPFFFWWSVQSRSACLVPPCTASLHESRDGARLSQEARTTCRFQHTSCLFCRCLWTTVWVGL